LFGPTFSERGVDEFSPIHPPGYATEQRYSFEIEIYDLTIFTRYILELQFAVRSIGLLYFKIERIIHGKITIFFQMIHNFTPIKHISNGTFLVHFPIGKRHYCPRFVRPSVRPSAAPLLLQFKLFRWGFLLKMCGLGLRQE